MTEGTAPAALDEKLRHELGNALMVVLSFSEIIDRHSPNDAVISDAVMRIREAVERASVATNDVSREMQQISSLVVDTARRLSSRI